VCSLRDAAEELNGLGVDVYALSLDGVEDLAAFAEAQEVEYGLLSDPDGSVASKYGVLARGEKFADRVSFVVDDQGVLRHVVRDVKVDSHGADVAELVTKLRG
jgi:peroxiredoxin Q/BCP